MSKSPKIWVVPSTTISNLISSLNGVSFTNVQKMESLGNKVVSQTFADAYVAKFNSIFNGQIDLGASDGKTRFSGPSFNEVNKTVVAMGSSFKTNRAKKIDALDDYTPDEVMPFIRQIAEYVAEAAAKACQAAMTDPSILPSLSFFTIMDRASSTFDPVLKRRVGQTSTPQGDAKLDVGPDEVMYLSIPFALLLGAKNWQFNITPEKLKATLTRLSKQWPTMNDKQKKSTAFAWVPVDAAFTFGLGGNVSQLEKRWPGYDTFLNQQGGDGVRNKINLAFAGKSNADAAGGQASQPQQKAKKQAPTISVTKPKFSW